MTRVLPAHSSAALTEAVKILSRGGLVAFPTDTVYGLAAHPFRPGAVARLYAAKERPRDKPIALLLAAQDGLHEVARDIPEVVWPLVERFWPGGLTVVLWRKETIPDIVSAGGETVALRLPDHAVARHLIWESGVPLAASSANLSGRPDPVDAEEVRRYLSSRIDLLLDGGPCPGVPSTVVDFTVSPPRLLREGAIPKEEMAKYLPQLVSS